MDSVIFQAMRNSGFFVGILGILVACVIPSADAWTPKPGCTFEDYSDYFYKVTSQGRTVYWRKTTEDGLFTNEGSNDVNGEIKPVFTKTGIGIVTSQTSEAVTACEKQLLINGKRLHLPTKSDYDALVRCFDSYSEKADNTTYWMLANSTDGIEAFQEKFKDPVITKIISQGAQELSGAYWASSVRPMDPNLAYVLDIEGNFAGNHTRKGKLAVRCVAK